MSSTDPTTPAGTTPVEPVSTPAPEKTATRRPWILPAATGAAGLAAGLALGLALPIGDPTTPTPDASAQAEPFTLTGTMVLRGEDSYFATYSTLESDCTGKRGYDDIRKGAAVTVYDETGKVIATGNLGAGHKKADTTRCIFPVSVPTVPRGPRFYQVEVSHRGKVNVTEAEAVAGGFGASLG